MSTSRIFLVGFYGAANLGDQAIRETIELAAPRLGAEVARYSSRASDGDARAVRMRGRGFPRYVRACLEADRVVLGGGGILKDEGMAMPLELLATAAIARLFGRPVSLLAVGVGPFYTRRGRVVIAAIARLASVRTVRDRQSARYLEGLGISDVEVCADPVFARAYSEPETLSQNSSQPGPRALLAVRPWFHMDADEGRARWPSFRDAMADVVAGLVERGWVVHLACLYWPEDRVAAEEIVRRAGAPEAVSISEGPMTWADLVGEVRSSDVVVAMRYHALAAAAVACRPVVALVYEPKVRSLATELEVPIVAVEDPDLSHRVMATLDPSDRRLSADPGAVAELHRRAWRALDRALAGHDG